MLVTLPLYNVIFTFRCTIHSTSFNLQIEWEGQGNNSLEDDLWMCRPLSACCGAYVIRLPLLTQPNTSAVLLADIVLNRWVKYLLQSVLI